MLCDSANRLREFIDLLLRSRFCHGDEQPIVGGRRMFGGEGGEAAHSRTDVVTGGTGAGGGLGSGASAAEDKLLEERGGEGKFEASLRGQLFGGVMGFL